MDNCWLVEETIMLSIAGSKSAEVAYADDQWPSWAICATDR